MVQAPSSSSAQLLTVWNLWLPSPDPSPQENFQDSNQFAGTPPLTPEPFLYSIVASFMSPERSEDSEVWKRMRKWPPPLHLFLFRDQSPGSGAGEPNLVPIVIRMFSSNLHITGKKRGSARLDALLPNPSPPPPPKEAQERNTFQINK